MESMTTMWNAIQTGVGGNIPAILGALAILVLGWIVALIVRAGVRKGLSLVRLNSHFTKLTGQTVNIEKGIAITLFWIVMLFTILAILNSLDLTLVSGPVAALLNTVFTYIPRLVGGLALALIAWLIASLARTVVNKVLSKTAVDERLSEHAGVPISNGLSQALFWFIILLFLPAILGALQMEALLVPLRDMVAKILDILPNIIAAIVIGGVGWIVATILRRLTTNLLRTAGSDKIGARADLKESVRLSSVAGLLVFVAVFLPAVIAALDAMKIEAISKPAINMLNMILAAVPHIIAAALILVITWFVASFASRLLATLLSTIGFDNLPRHAGLAHAFEKTPASVFVGHIALFFAMLFAFVEASNQLGFTQVGSIVDTFIRFGGDVLLGSVILAIGFWLANLAHEAIDRASGPKTKSLARIVRFAILGLVLALGLRAMGIANDIVNLAFGLTLGAVAVAVALSFGLGGREAAGKLVEDWLSKFHSHNRP